MCIRILYYCWSFCVFDHNYNRLKMDRLNEDDILTFVSYLNIAAILAFGATNVRHQRIVSKYFNTLAVRGRIAFFLDCPQSAIREFLQHFGTHFFHLDIHIGEELINMDIFQDFDGCLTPNINQLIIRASIVEPNQQLVELDGVDSSLYGYEFEDFINERQVEDNMQQMIDRFRRNSQIVIDSINNNAIPNLRHIAFHFEFTFSVPTYIFLDRSMLMFNAVIPVVSLLFFSLHRGNLHFDHEFESGIHSLKLILLFNF